MKKLFYVEPNQILRVSFESVFKQSGWDIYTLNSMDDFDFRFKDFEPDILLLDDSFSNNSSLVDLKNLTTQIPVGFIGKENSLESDDFFFIQKPIDLYEIVKTVECFLK